MTVKEKVQHVLNKYPRTKYNRGLFFWFYIQEHFFDHKSIITKEQFLEFWKEEATAERTLRKLLKDKINPQKDQLRYQKAKKFKKKFSKKQQGIDLDNPKKLSEYIL